MILQQTLMSKCRSCDKIYEFKGEVKTASKNIILNVSLKAMPRPLVFDGLVQTQSLIDLNTLF